MKWSSIISALIPTLPANAMILLAITSFALYYTQVQAPSPTRQHVAAGSMALVGTLAGLGYRDFLGRMRHLQERQAKVEEAIVALALVVQCGDPNKTQRIVTDLIRDKEL